MKRSDIVGLHRIKNKVSRNSFDLSHRHMFTAQIGEILPIFSEWVNPGDTLKLGYNGLSRTAPLQTAAFTRLKENVQYYFVPFQSLWKYFEQVVTNMTEGQSGENISKFAASASSADKLGTSLPYIGYLDLIKVIDAQLSACLNAIYTHFHSVSSSILPADALNISYQGYMNVLSTSHLSRNDSFRYSSFCKLLNYLGYGNFPLMHYDIISNWQSYVKSLSDFKTASVAGFKSSSFSWSISLSHTHTPNLSILPLLAYHKVINDHYRYKQWQPFEPWTCNIDYITPSSNMNFASCFTNWNFDSNTCIFDLEYSNLPLDYFNGVLPRAQYGDESAAVVNNPLLTGSTVISGSTGAPRYGGSSTTAVYSDGGSSATNVSLRTDSTGRVAADGSSANPLTLHDSHSHSILNIHGSVSVPASESSLRISALRSAIALQKYKEVQNSNDSDFAAQVLAHFGVKPKNDDRTSLFIGGSDSIIDINPQVNQNLTGDNQAEIKAIATGDLSAGCKFTANTYGIVIGLYRCVPQLDIAHCGIDRQLLKTDASDFVIPELDSIGMQTQYKFELFAPPVGKFADDFLFENIGTDNSVDMSSTYGYAPRYCEYKTSFDRVDGAFNSVLSSWVVGYNSLYLHRWLTPNNDFWSPIDFNRLLVCTPSICYPIFQEQVSGCVANDKIFVGSVNTCVAVRNLSVHGLPYTK